LSCPRYVFFLFSLTVSAVADRAQNIKDGIEGHPVSWYSEVFDLVFANLDKEAAKHIWKEQLAEPPSSSGKRSSKKKDDSE